MKLGFSTLALFMKPNEEIVKIAEDNGFDMIEILCEGPYSPKYLLEHKKYLKAFYNTNLELCIHSPTVDLNIASINQGIREESTKQTMEAIDLAEEIGATAITTHPGQVGRKEERIRNMGMKYTIDSIKKLVDYSEGKNITISVENMPKRFSFLCNRTEELEKVVEETGCGITIDLGHANTCENPAEFLDLNNIKYYHLNDNNGEKDQHYSLGEGTLDLNLLKKVNKGIIELNNFDNVLKSKELIRNQYP